MHLAIEMIRESSIVVQPAQIRAADVTDLKFLMTAGTGGVREGFEIAFFLLFGGFGDTDFVVLGHCERDGGGFAQDGDFKQAGVDGCGEVGYLF